MHIQKTVECICFCWQVGHKSYPVDCQRPKRTHALDNACGFIASRHCSHAHVAHTEGILLIDAERLQNFSLGWFAGIHIDWATWWGSRGTSWYLLRYDHPWSYMIICNHILWYMLIYNHLWSYMIIYDDICSYMIVCDHIWSYTMIYTYIWSSMIIYDLIQWYICWHMILSI